MLPTYTRQQLESITTDDLITLYAKNGLRSNRMNKHFIARIWLVDDLSEYFEAIAANSSATGSYQSEHFIVVQL
jgi:hypothetical protein